MLRRRRVTDRGGDTYDADFSTAIPAGDYAVDYFEQATAKQPDFARAYVALSGSTQEVAERVLRTIGGDALVADPRFRTNADRVANGEALDALIDAFCGTRPRDDVIAELTGAGCAVGPLESIASVFENPQIAARGSLATLRDPELGEVVVNNAFPLFERAGAPALRPGPSQVGADTEEVLARELGLSADELHALEESGVISGPLTLGLPRDRDTGGSRT